MMSAEDFKARLNKELSTLDSKHIVLMNIESEHYSDSIFETLRYMTGKGMGGVYLTSARPYDFLSKKLEKDGIDTKNIYFIDTVSCMIGDPPGEMGNRVFIKSPAALDDIEIWAYRLLEKIDAENKFLLIDSVSNMLIYNDAGKLAQFSKSLVNYLRSRKVSGVIASVVGEIEAGFHNVMTDLCDRVIKI